ncbi:thioredoxin family protein [Butyricicoccus sp.]|uniref:thioredoxin family protein n=1 Tax=Butyricicoccus sp. TaxID=2049021 RepID=UPI003AF97721
MDEQPTLALLHRVVSIPTVSIYSEGKEVKRLIGLRDKPELVEAIQEVLKK